MPVRRNTLTISHDELKRLLSYDPEAGIFKWLVRRGPAAPAGSRAGKPHHTGYRHITVARVVVAEHRLAWFYAHGKWPECEIDHVNRIKDDNRLANLREATRSLNQANSGQRSDNKAGHRGVSWHNGNGRWIASIGYQGKKIHIGSYKTPEAAAAAYAAKAAVLFGSFSSAEQGSHLQ
jgi:hypothetical protein